MKLSKMIDSPRQIFFFSVTGCPKPSCCLLPPYLARILGFLCLVLLTGCLRFSSAVDTSKGAEAGEVVTVETFEALERGQQMLLRKLVDARAVEGAKSRQSYHVGSEDVVEIQVFDAPELGAVVRVTPQGFITLPDIGEVQVAGLSEVELQKKLEKELATILVRPRVRVFIKEYGAHKVSVIGEVNRPGRYALKQDSSTLLDVLSDAGGKNQRAGASVVLIPARVPQSVAAANAKLQRANQLAFSVEPDSRARLGTDMGEDRLYDQAGDPSALSIEVRYDDLVGGVSRKPLVVPLEPGDTIIVPEAGMVQVSGEVQKPGSFQLSSRMTVLGAVAAGGGLTYSADVDSVQVVRELPSGKKVVLPVDLEKIADRRGSDVRLRDGDVVNIPSQGVRFATRQVVDLVNRVLNVGVSRSY